LLTSLKEAGHRDWFVGSVGKQIATNLKWLKDPTNSKNINIDPDRIAMIGYSIGGIRAGAAAKVEPVRGMIYLNSGNRNFRKAKKPFADYLIITGLEQKAGWVDGNARLKGEIKNAGAYVQKLDLPGVGHVNWRKENKLVIDTITAFLVDRVQKKGEGQVEPLCSTTCEGRFVKCCEVRQASGMKSNEAFELCSSSVRRGGDYWKNIAKCLPQCQLTEVMTCTVDQPPAPVSLQTATPTASPTSGQRRLRHSEAPSGTTAWLRSLVHFM
jgi:hypothetical protein